MGTELLLAALPAVSLSPERRQQLHLLVAGLTEEDLQQLGPDEWGVGGPQELRRTLHENVEALHGPDEGRDVVPLQVPRMPYLLWVTGGMSWGDDPTDIYECFCLLGACDAIYSQLNAWARADAADQSAS